MTGLIDQTADNPNTIGGNSRCRAWVSFNGTGTIAINKSDNVSSVTDAGTGNYVFNMTQAMPDTNYCAVGAASISGNFVAVKTSASSKTAVNVDTSDDGRSWTDAVYVGCAVFR